MIVTVPNQASSICPVVQQREALSGLLLTSNPGARASQHRGLKILVRPLSVMVWSPWTRTTADWTSTDPALSRHSLWIYCRPVSTWAACTTAQPHTCVTCESPHSPDSSCEQRTLPRLAQSLESGGGPSFPFQIFWVWLVFLSSSGLVIPPSGKEPQMNCLILVIPCVSQMLWYLHWK